MGQHHAKAAEAHAKGNVEEAGTYANHAMDHLIYATEHTNEAAKKTVEHHEKNGANSFTGSSSIDPKTGSPELLVVS